MRWRCSPLRSTTRLVVASCAVRVACSRNKLLTHSSFLFSRFLQLYFPLPGIRAAARSRGDQSARETGHVRQSHCESGEGDGGAMRGGAQWLATGQRTLYLCDICVCLQDDPHSRSSIAICTVAICQCVFSFSYCVMLLLS